MTKICLTVNLALTSVVLSSIPLHGNISEKHYNLSQYNRSVIRDIVTQL